MSVHFYKYHGTGNDFILADNRDGALGKEDTAFYSRLCHRRFGIGADGVILLEGGPGELRMVYFNSDGRESSFCGNGGRCFAAFANKSGLTGDEVRFSAIDGMHEARIISPGVVRLRMKDVEGVELAGEDVLLNTGSPHFVRFVTKADEVNVAVQGRAIRQSARFAKEGINVNFVECRKDGLYVRTYERGVEDETWSCGTGVVASALAAVAAGRVKDESPSVVVTRGGRLRVHYKRGTGNRFSDIRLEGNAVAVFEGEIEKDL